MSGTCGLHRRLGGFTGPSGHWQDLNQRCPAHEGLGGVARPISRALKRRTKQEGEEEEQVETC